MPRRRTLSGKDLEKLTDEQLLQVRIRDLGLSIDGTVLEPRIQRLHEEIAARGLHFRPPSYLADEWLCPDRMPVIGIPFYLAHPRLTQLERTMMLEAEGDTDAWCMKLLRHEAGHAINYAYRFYRRTRWRELFGTFTERYSSNYYAQPYSRRFVTHLEDHYAQAHPDEDFAETFAVWLTPGDAWRERYRGRPAMRKLRYVDHLMSAVADTPPSVTEFETPWAAARMRSTLQAYYQRKQRMLGNDFPGYYDPAVLRVFPNRDPKQGGSAARFITRNRRRIVSSVALWTHQRKWDVDELLRKLARRCRDLGCRTHRSDADTLVDLTALVAAVMSNAKHLDHGA